MKKLVLFLVCALALVCLCTGALADVAIDDAHFPDTVFQNEVRNYDTDGDGILSDDEIALVNIFSLEQMEITSLKGVEYFTRLEKLLCAHNKLTSLDVSQNTALTELDCRYNQIAAIDLRQNPELISLSVGANPLGNLDISQNKKLQQMWCFQNGLAKLDLSNNPELTALSCYGNSLTRLDISHNPGMETLWCNKNPMTALDVTPCTSLCTLVQTTDRIARETSDIWLAVIPDDGELFVLTGTPGLEVDKKVTVTAGSTVSAPTAEPTDEPTAEPTAEPAAPTTATVGALKYSLKGSAATVIAPKSKNAKSIKIPATIKVEGKTYKVTAIKDNAFKGMKKLTNVEIGANVKTIGKNAFNKCVKLKNIVIKTTKLTTKTVGANAFKGVYKKATVKVPASKLKAYKTLLVKKGLPKTAKVKK